MSQILRALLEEAAAVQFSDEPPGDYGDPVKEGETMIDRVPRDIRQMITLARLKNMREVQLADSYRCTADPDGSRLAEICRLALEARLLESNALGEIAHIYAAKTKGLGTLWVRAGWVVAWSPIVIDEEIEDENAAAARPVFDS